MFGDPDGALAALDEALALDPNDKNVRELRAKIEAGN